MNMKSFYILEISLNFYVLKLTRDSKELEKYK